MKIFVLLAALVGLAFGTHPQIRFNGRIVHGQDASITQFPYQASVLVNMSPICGGSILTDRIVLTAAHCTYGGDVRTYGIHVGDTDVLYVKFGQYIPVAKIVQNEQYDPKTTNHDMSLLILSESISFSQGAQPIALDRSAPQVGAMATVTGWGTTTEGGSISRILQQVDVPIMSDATCRALYPGMISDLMICAGFTSGYYDSCQGDSGGPLALEGKLVGVVSWGIGCAEAGRPGVYASVAHMYDWITSNVRMHS